ncbi:Isopentenyl phosphate kinase [Entamoeba marina]
MSDKAPEVVLIKVGGSFSTQKLLDKKQLKLDNINSFINQLVQFMQSHSHHQIILAHGAGSYGHMEAKKYNLDKGFDSTKTHGVVKSVQAVTSLNSLIIDLFAKQRLNAFPFHSHDFCVTENTRISEMFIHPIQIALNHGFIPVLHGDIAMDSKQGCSILSTDQILPELAYRFGAKRVGFLCQSCVFDDNNEPIKEINTENYDEIKKMLHESSGTDVSGGMAGKIKELIEAAKKYDIESYVFNGTDNALRRFLNGEHEGTKVCK